MKYISEQCLNCSHSMQTEFEYLRTCFDIHTNTNGSENEITNSLGTTKKSPILLSFAAAIV